MNRFSHRPYFVDNGETEVIFQRIRDGRFLKPCQVDAKSTGASNESGATTMFDHELDPALTRTLEHVFIHHPHRKLRAVHVVANRSGKVRLTGHVSTYFEKQIAQETIRRIQGIESVSNEITVE
jgi:osmotically-inducible protein OsmY